jgi:hypothetical protein
MAFKVEAPQDPPMDLIQGQTPGSQQEWRVAVALNRMKLAYEYQRREMGGRRVRGGQVIDFWVFTVPLPTAIYVQGEYWHGGKKVIVDQLNVEKLKEAYNGQLYVELIPERELGSVDQALAALRRRLQ